MSDLRQRYRRRPRSVRRWLDPLDGVDSIAGLIEAGLVSEAAVDARRTVCPVDIAHVAPVVGDRGEAIWFSVAVGMVDGAPGSAGEAPP